MHSQKENPVFNIAFNILIPVIVLNKGHILFQQNAGVYALLLALAFPLFYGLFDLAKNKRKNFISLLGALNVCFTGGFALYQLSGIWFAIKEAMFPLLIGAFVLLSVYTKKSFFEYLMSSFPLKWGLIKEKVSAQDQKSLYKKATIWFSLSFLISAILNFSLALYIFADESQWAKLSESEQEIILNQKIADMTYLGFLFIGLPLAVFSAFILWRFLKKLSQITGLTIEEILAKKPTS